MKYVLVLALALAGCCTCPPKTTVTPRPNVYPVVHSNKKLEKQVKDIKSSSTESLKVNKSLQGDLDSADKELEKLLKR